MQSSDYYQTLEIDRQATAREIRQAFRRLAKRYHPDKNPRREKSVEQRFYQICFAYETLRDSQQKFRYDLTLRVAKREQNLYDVYLERLRKTQQIREKYELMFHELLNRNHEAGIRTYEQLQRSNRKFCIDDFLSYEDSRDCEFLIAEAYQIRGNYQMAMRIYESLLLYEKYRPVFHHFTEEIKEQLKKIYFRYLVQPGSLEDIPTNLEKIRMLNLSKRETAWIYKKLSEFYLEIHWVGKAKEMLQMAFELHPHLTGAKKICQKLGLEYLSLEITDLSPQNGKTKNRVPYSEGATRACCRSSGL